MKKPLVGLNADLEEREGRPFHKLFAEYTASVRAAGGVPVVLPTLASENEAASALATLDGLVLTGGRDLPAESYGQQPHPKTSCAAKERLDSDFILARAAFDAGLPILAICMGCQLVNVSMGGTLIQDIPSEVEGALDHSRHDAGDRVVHRVKIRSGSRLGSILDSETIEANSTHHQAVKDPGRGLVPVAWADDGVIEAVEADDGWILAVQWHPERLTSRREHLALFEALVREAAKRGARRPR